MRFSAIDFPLLGILMAFLCADRAAALERRLNYQTPSENGRFLAVVDHDPAGQVELRVYEAENGGLKQLWKVAPSTSIGEQVHVSDDGRAVVIEDGHEQSSCAVAIFREGILLKKYSTGDLGMGDTGPRRPGAQVDIADGPATGRLSRDRHLGFFSKTAQGACYCVWILGVKGWRAWGLEDGEAIVVSLPQAQKWMAEAEQLVSRAVREEDKPVAAWTRVVDWTATASGSRLLMMPALPSPDICFKFLTKKRSSEDRKFLQDMLSDGHFKSRWVWEGGMVLHQYSPKRSAADRLLAKFNVVDQEDWVRMPSQEPRYYKLGGVEGFISVPNTAPITNTVLWVSLIPLGTNGPVSQSVSPRQLAVDLAAPWPDLMDPPVNASLPFNGKIHYQFEDVLPGNYFVRAVCRPQGSDPTSTSITLSPGDFAGNITPGVTVFAGLTVGVAPIACNRAVGALPGAR